MNCSSDEQLHVTQPTEAQLWQQNCQPNTQTRGAEANTVMPEVQITYPEEQTTYPQTSLWSLKCLLELSWNYDNAFSAFQKLHKQGQTQQGQIGGYLANKNTVHKQVRDECFVGY
ncbi:hypothetical protein K0M31_007126 [Melipona bicolor]|uniref:TAP-C domain-containing protein n=1 Tax=Melipona bicolor TaxID=60889 RepID=A0AA40FRQ7_9HYME|nr:hypothetical protein K0M31_007126 [Melipona bicolor]